MNSYFAIRVIAILLLAGLLSGCEDKERAAREAAQAAEAAKRAEELAARKRALEEAQRQEEEAARKAEQQLQKLNAERAAREAKQRADEAKRLEAERRQKLQAAEYSKVKQLFGQIKRARLNITPRDLVRFATLAQRLNLGEELVRNAEELRLIGTELRQAHIPKNRDHLPKDCFGILVCPICRGSGEQSTFTRSIEREVTPCQCAGKPSPQVFKADLARNAYLLRLETIDALLE